MKRRTLLGAGLASASVLAVPATAQNRLALSLVTDRPDAANALAERVAKVSSDRITIEVAASDAADAAGFLDGVSGGGSDMYLTSSDAFVARNPAFGLFAAMPGGMSASELESWVLVADGRFMLDLLGEEFGIKAFIAGDDGAMPIWSRAPLQGLSDLIGGTVVSAGLGLNVLTEMGVGNTVDVMSATDLGGATAIEGLSITQMAAAGLLETFPHMATPNAGRPSAMLNLGVNITTWSNLPESDRMLLERCIMAEHSTQRALALHRNVTAIADATVTAQAMPQDIWDAQITAANAVMTGMFDAGDVAADTADAYLYFISDVAGWSEIGETAYFLGRKQALSQ
ncbi:hypothetical protein [Yoonia sp. 2307UL14-13]|uniref:hypothetical protein n=1 Tax=Yoonia sp. 2307UL14-13 TaxID=3126506 RepID=UPI0030B48258